MRSKFITLISILLLASAGLADRRSSSQFLDAAEKRTSDTSDPAECLTGGLSGAVWEQPTATFWAVRGTFQVPPLLGPRTNGSGVGFWVGLDVSPGGTPRCHAMFSAGVTCKVAQDKTICTALAQWYPQQAIQFTDIEVSPGDNITVNVRVASNRTTGYAMMENKKYGTGQERVTQTLTFTEPSSPLCRLNAAWYVTNAGGGDLPLPDFRLVSFENPEAFGPIIQKFTALGTVLYEIYENDRPATTTQVLHSGETLAVWHGTLS